jgi:hypothetical protein
LVFGFWFVFVCAYALCLVCLRPVSCVPTPCVLCAYTLCLVCLHPVSCVPTPCVLCAYALCLVCLRPVSCVPSVASISGLFILDYPFKNWFLHHYIGTTSVMRNIYCFFLNMSIALFIIVICGIVDILDALALQIICIFI